MEKIKLTNKMKILGVISLCLVLVISINFGVRVMFGTINENIAELGVVVTPTKPANRFYYQIISIDTFEYWVFNLNERESEPIIEDIEDGNWTEMTSNHIDKLEYFEYYDKIFKDDYKEHKCYICIYDELRGRIITSSENQIWEDTTGWIIFLYDMDDSKYYCVYETY